LYLFQGLWINCCINRFSSPIELKVNNHSSIIYACRAKDQETYFVSKCRSDSDAPYKDKKNILAPSDPSRIVALKEFEDEMDSLDYLDRLTYELGFEADGSGTLQNSWISPYHLRVGKKCTQPVTVYRREDESSMKISCLHAKYLD